MNTAEIKISFWGDFAGQGHFNDCLASGHSFDMLRDPVQAETWVRNHSSEPNRSIRMHFSDPYNAGFFFVLL